MNYIEQLEEQNEQLQKKLAEYQKPFRWVDTNIPLHDDFIVKIMYVGDMVFGYIQKAHTMPYNPLGSTIYEAHIFGKLVVHSSSDIKAIVKYIEDILTIHLRKENQLPWNVK